MNSDQWYSGPDLARLILADVALPQFQVFESVIGKQWLLENMAEWSYFGFNMRTGTGIELGPEFLPGIKKSALLSTQKRIDIVCKRPGATLLVEVKVRISLGTLGQLLGYKTLWQSENLDAGTIDLLCVAGAAMPDTHELLEANRIGVKLYADLWQKLGSPGH